MKIMTFGAAAQKKEIKRVLIYMKLEDFVGDLDKENHYPLIFSDLCNGTQLEFLLFTIDYSIAIRI